MRHTRLVFPSRHFATLVVMLCAFPAAILAQVTAAQKSPEPLAKLVDVGGYRVHLYCTGAVSPAVVIVGAGYSFDWGPVQPEVAKLTQVCTYDHSGIGWSDSGPQDSCDLRVDEVHTALKKAGINGPYVLVGHSLGALVSRLEADALTKKHPQLLGDKPLVNVSTDVRVADYVKLQADLLRLSKNSKEIVAQNSTHFVIIDRPDVVVDAIKQAVQSIRPHTPLLPM
jgi:hypothetical protein